MAANPPGLAKIMGVTPPFPDPFSYIVTIILDKVLIKKKKKGSQPARYPPPAPFTQSFFPESEERK
jgi:hypothetical protein